MVLCANLGCQGAAGCQCNKYQLGHAVTVMPMGCVCPGDATPYCQNPFCPRKALLPVSFAPVQMPGCTVAAPTR